MTQPNVAALNNPGHISDHNLIRDRLIERLTRADADRDFGLRVPLHVAGRAYVVGELVVNAGLLYRVTTAHVSTATFVPANFTQLASVVTVSSTGTIVTDGATTQLATDAELEAHRVATTAVHGIADTAALLRPGGVGTVAPAPVTVDLAAIAANTTVTVDLTLPAGSLLAADSVVGWSNSGTELPHGLLLVQIVGRTVDNVVRVRFANLTGVAIDLAVSTFIFYVRKGA